jgi:hypothetical protein
MKTELEKSTHRSSFCYLSEKVTFGDVPPRGMGLTANDFIAKGELVLILGGTIVSQEDIVTQDHHFSIQVEEEHFISPVDKDYPFRINHSCNPTLGVRGQISYIALRDISPGEEINYDYAMTDGVAFEMEDGSIYDEFSCQCGSANCRGSVSGEDWKRPELWERYEGHFSLYLQRRIDRLKQKRNGNGSR